MALYGSLETIRAQTAKMGIFGPAFAYLDDVIRPDSAAGRSLRAVALGKTQRVELTGGCFAIEQAFLSKLRAESFFESHRKFIDIQVVLEGEERMDLADIGRLAVSKPYDAERDLIIYADYTEASILRVKAGEAAVFFPVDGHMPTLRAGTVATPVRKTVVKVPLPAVG
ncbi:MAG: YhcH/YjgK/YiaL family protein [Verrucomicrobia bacterium]|nr:YhcH/YjgK/YiaL family protein [Verrucomicrobiota bacterium]